MGELMQSQELSKTQTGQITKSDMPDSWGAESILPGDIVIPRIRQLHSISKAVNVGSGKPGQLVHSLTGELLCDKDKVLEIIPIKCIPMWVINKRDGNKWKFYKQMIRTVQNDNLPYEGFEGKLPVQRIKQLTFLVMLVNKIDGFPFFLDFSKSGFKAGKNLCQFIAENSKNNKSAADRVIGLSSHLQSNAENSWYSYEVKPVRLTKPQELAACFEWYSMYNNSNAMVAASEETIPVDAGTDFATDNGVF